MFSKEYLEFPALILSVLHNLIQNTLTEFWTQNFYKRMILQFLDTIIL